MKQILGYLSLDGSPVPDIGSHGPSHTSSATDRCYLAAPTIHRQQGRTIAILGQPRIEGANGTSKDTGAQILDLYCQSGAALFAQLRGPYAVGIVDPKESLALLAIDRMGIETLSWAFEDDRLVFGTSPAGVADCLSRAPRINPQSLFNCMLTHVVTAPNTAYLGVNKLLAGTYLHLRAGRVELRRHWEPKFNRSANSARRLAYDVIPALNRAIERCSPDEHTGTFLSGGLDSSTVTGLLARNRKAPISAFSVGFGVDEYDEMSFARIASGAFGCDHHIYEVSADDIVDLIPRIAAAYDEPFGNSSAVPTYCCARLAKSNGIDHLLAGDGGDEIFAGNERYVRHRIFELYGRLPRWLRSNMAEPLAGVFDVETSLLPFRKFASYVRQARIPLPERFESWNLIYREGADNIFSAEFLAGIDPEHQLREYRKIWESCPSDDLLDRMLWYDWKFTLADNDLRKVARMCELAGVRVSFPMLDEELVELSMNVPSSAKIVGTELRAFFKDAVRDILPREIINKRKHGFGLPFGLWLKTSQRLQELVYDTLDSLSNRKIIREDFIDRVVTDHRAGHASYYGYAIWDMVMLEQWLQKQPDPAGSSLTS